MKNYEEIYNVAVCIQSDVVAGIAVAQKEH